GAGGGPAGAVRLRLDGDVVESEVLAREADPVARPERATDLEDLEETSDPALERHAHRGELATNGRRVGGDADTEDDAPFGRAIQRADDVGEHDGLAQR